MRPNSANNTNHDIISTALMIFSIAIIPLIVHLKMNPVDQEALNFWNNNTNGDFFSYYKSIFICGAALLTGGLLIIKKVSLRKLLYLIPAGIMTLCIILSAVFSPHPYTAVHGFPDRYEGVWVLLSYSVLLIGASTLIQNIKQVKAIVISLLVSAAAIGTIGILQYVGLDFFQTGLGRSLVDFSQINYSVTVEHKLNTLGTASYGTLYNPNGFGMYMAMLFPFALFMSLLANTRTKRVLLTLLTCLLFAALLGSFSRGSLVAAAASVFVTALLIRKQLYIHWKQALGILLLCLAAYFIMNAVSTGDLSNRVRSLAAIDQIHLEDQRIDKVKDYSINGKELSLYCTKSFLKVKQADFGLFFYDDHDREIRSYVDQDGFFRLAENRYRDYIITFNNNLLKIQKGKSYLYFRIENETFTLLQANGEAAELTPVPKYGFEGLERIGSGRGYIWSRSLPMLRETLIIGQGPDTFALEFPQKDYRGKLNYMYDAYLIIDKPHNMYLQAALNNGLLMLLAMLAVFGIYLARSAKTINRGNHNDLAVIIEISIFAAVIGYLAAGLFTDSTVSVAPVFWLLLGLGFGVDGRIDMRGNQVV